MTPHDLTVVQTTQTQSHRRDNRYGLHPFAPVWACPPPTDDIIASDPKEWCGDAGRCIERFNEDDSFAGVGGDERCIYQAHKDLYVCVRCAEFYGDDYVPRWWDSQSRAAQ